MDEWIKGQWYLAVTCRNCGVEFPFSREDQLIDTYSTDSAKLVLTCPDCAFPIDYSGEQIKRIQAE